MGFSCFNLAISKNLFSLSYEFVKMVYWVGGWAEGTAWLTLWRIDPSLLKDTGSKK